MQSYSYYEITQLKDHEVLHITFVTAEIEVSISGQFPKKFMRTLKVEHIVTQQGLTKVVQDLMSSIIREESKKHNIFLNPDTEDFKFRVV